MSQTALEIQHLTKRYGQIAAVDDFSLRIEAGEFFGLLGQNGAGKTTVIQCVTGIGRFVEGTISVFGHDVQTDYRAARACVGLSPQEFNMDIFAPTQKILQYMGGYFGLAGEDLKKRIEDLLTRFELQEHRNKPAGRLSGGLKRRLTIARAMIHDPDLLILDEPTAGIDVRQRHELWRYLQEIHAGGKTILLTSHYLEEVERLCSRVAIVHQGKLLRILTRDEFTSEGKNLEETFLKLTGGSENTGGNSV